ncbi:hypothetical protein GCM10023176_00130 [Micromonospora coerulea]|uniref:YaaC-like protein n=1 Tax=Micromonospora coerulea TaxID=47856 RepID=A0ABP8S5D3_9ACTN
MRFRDERAVWSDLRATRHAPPGGAAVHPERRSTYVAALQQAEELFRAAETSGPASSPLLLFYGLSQAGRALTAAAAVLQGDDWQLSGHGIKAACMSADLPKINVMTPPKADKTSFVRLSRLLDSPVWTGADPVTLAQLWDAIPGMAEHPLGTDDKRRSPLEAVPNSPQDGHQIVSALVSGFPHHLASVSATRADFDAFMASYPTALGYIPVVDQTGKPQYHDYADTHGLSVQMSWEAGTTYPVAEDVRIARINAVVRHYARGHFYLFAQTIAGGKPLHPLMTWWTVLYTLSMLARYQPSEWSHCIDINSSPFASVLEHLLDEARTVVPDLVLTTLETVAT